MIDVSKIKVGDEVTVRGHVVHINNDRLAMPYELGINFRNRADASWTNIPTLCIATHTPAPREFKPGDRAIVYDAVTDSKDLCDVLAIDDAFAWIRNTKSGGRWTARLSDLRHADESE